jgi:hypothetical protein
MRPELIQEQIDYFLTGIDFTFFWHEPERTADWRAAKDELLADFTAERPGHRPFFWWKADAPGPRLRVGGRGDLVPAFDHPDNLKYGIFRRSAFVSDHLLAAVAPVGAGLTPFDPEDPPRFESEASYLDRHGLLSVAERKALPADAFEPEKVGC